MRQSLDGTYVVDQHEPIETAMALIEQNQHRSAIVVNERKIVVGTLSDGDIRKAMLDHRLLSTPVHQVMNTNFIAIRLGEVDKAPGIFEREHIFLIPVVDDKGRLLKALKAY